MQLAKDWKKRARYAWSFWLNILSIIFGLAELALPILDQMYDIPRGLFLVLSVVVSAISNGAKLMSQKEFRNDEQS